MNPTRTTPRRTEEKAHERTEDRAVSSRSGKLLLASRARELLGNARPHIERRTNDLAAAMALRDGISEVLLDSSAPCLLGEKTGSGPSEDLYHALSDCKRLLEQRIIDMKPRC